MSPMSQCLKLGASVFAHASLVDVKLDVGRETILEGGEAGFAHDALEHHAAGHFNRNFLGSSSAFSSAPYCAAKSPAKALRLK